MTLHELLNAIDDYQQQQCPNHAWKDRFAAARRDLNSGALAGEYYVALAAALGYGQLTMDRCSDVPAGNYVYRWRPRPGRPEIGHVVPVCQLAQTRVDLGERVRQIAEAMRTCDTSADDPDAGPLVPVEADR